jgi:Amt family ammonium transporter
VVGVVFLWLGWFGFNGGNALASPELLPTVILNTAVAGAVGLFSILFLVWWRTGSPAIPHALNGTLGGLVSVTAGAHMFQPYETMLVSFIGAAFYMHGHSVLIRMKIDDAVGAIAVHLLPGVWRAIAMPLLATNIPNPAGLDLSRIEFLQVQVFGSVVICLYAFCTTYVLTKILNKFIPIRVSAAAEEVGLNISEHRASSSAYTLLRQLNEQANTGDFTKVVVVPPNTEAEEIATFYNPFRERFNTEANKAEKALDQASWLANYDGMTGILNRRAFMERVSEEVARQARSGQSFALLMFDIDFFKQANDTHGHAVGDEAIRLMVKAAQSQLRAIDFGPHRWRRIYDITTKIRPRRRTNCR